MTTRVTKQQLIDLQQKLINTQEALVQAQAQVLARTPQDPGVDTRWHIANDISAEEVLESNDIDVLTRYSEWLLDYGNQHLRPYLHPTAYSEVMYHLRLPVITKLAELETRRELGLPLPSPKRKRAEPIKDEEPSPNGAGQKQRAPDET